MSDTAMQSVFSAFFPVEEVVMSSLKVGVMILGHVRLGKSLHFQNIFLFQEQKTRSQE